MSIEKILIVDEDLLARDFISDILRKKHLEVIPALQGKEALEILHTSAVDMILADMNLSDMPRFEFLEKIKEMHPDIPFVAMTTQGNTEHSTQAIRLGAFSYLLKPCSPEVILSVIEKAREHITLVEENKYLRHQVSSGGSTVGPRVIAESPVMKQILTDVMQVAKSNASVLISGESGTGKEVIAHTIHYNSMRANRPFIRVNCAAMPESLIESEFFGHEKGAFTGANAKRLGRFELASSGTLMLDEITEIPLVLQAKLLRAVQEQEFERVGGNKTVKVDVRLISTSNRDVKDAVANKHLREDLYYRLNVVPIQLPPLRERREDIIPLAQFFLEKMCVGNQRPKKKLTEGAKKKLLEYPWPGNIRELANIIERAIVLDASASISVEHIHLEDGLKTKKKAGLPVGITLQELEERMIIETLQQHQDPLEAAEILGISVRKLNSKLRKK